jgi:hypothetical protein
MGYSLGWNKPTLDSKAKLNRCLDFNSILKDVIPATNTNLADLTIVLNQLSLGSCTAQAVAQAERCTLVASGVKNPPLMSRLALYLWGRALDNSIEKDVGSQVGTVFEALCIAGCPIEDLWPYDISKFKIRPPTEIYRNAYDFRGAKGINYFSLAPYGDALLTDIKKALTAGYVVAFGSRVTDDFCDRTPHGVIPAIGPLDTIAGGHAQVVAGHDDDKEAVLVKNSWGEHGDPDCPPGCAWFSYDYVRQEFDDAHIVTLSPREAAYV